MKDKLSNYLHVISIFILMVILPGCNTPTPERPAPAEPPAITGEPSLYRTIHILLDDFKPQPYQGQSVYFFNRLEGDRGAINNSIMAWSDGQVTTTISEGNSWGGVWMSLNHPIREELPIDFSGILPAQILPEYQSRIVGLTVLIGDGTPGRTFKLELKNGSNLGWKEEVILQGGAQTLTFDLPALGNINHLVWVLDHADPGDFVIIERVSFTTTTQITDTATAAFVWSYGMLLNNWNPVTGLGRDKAKDASGEFDAIQATGSLAAATAVAYQLGVIDKADAIQIVDRISSTLLNDLPRHHGLLPHWVKTSSTGKFVIVDWTEWSSVDTIIAALGLLEAQTSLGLDASGTEQLLKEIDWNDLVTANGISHGYTYDGNLIPYAWDAFGGESWLVQLAYAGATGQVAPLAYPSPPTANGSGFIDELAWLFVPPPSHDYWGTDWSAYRQSAAKNQIDYFPSQHPSSCFASLGLFGLSAGEVPAPAQVSQNNIYQAYGVGGAFAPANDGSQFGAPVVAPHYSAMTASLRPEEAIAMWDWLIANDFFSPLNNVESLAFPDDDNCNPAAVKWNQLKGSWNLSLQTLGWGRYLVEQNGQMPILWQTVETNPFLWKGYSLLVPTSTAVAQPPTLMQTPTPILKTYERECEYPDEATVGQTLDRSNASGTKVHGQFGTEGSAPWSARWGDVTYNNINISQNGTFYLMLHYSKNSPASAYILVYLDDEQTKRAAFMPVNQGDWNRFAWTDHISLGEIENGVHSIKFATNGQQYGVADLDRFIIVPQILSAETQTTSTDTSVPPPAETSTIITGNQASCEGKPLNMWGSPGTYRYQLDDGSYFTLTLKPGEAIPDMGVSGPYGSVSSPPQTEEITTALGTFQATTTSVQREYNIFTGRYDYFKGVYRRQEWYVCEYGLVKLVSSDSGTKTPGDYTYSNSVSFVLVSFTPQPDN